MSKSLLEKAITSALFDSKLRTTDSPRFSFRLGARTTKCMAARKGETGEAMVSAFAFLLTALDKGQLEVGIDPVDETTMLIRKSGSSSGTSFRAVVDNKYGNVRVITDQESETMIGSITGISIGMLCAAKYLGDMPQFRENLENELAAGKADVMFDAFYYNLKHGPLGGATISIEYDDVAVNTMFDRADSMKAVPVPIEMEALVTTAEFPFVGKTPYAGGKKPAEADPEEEKKVAAPVLDEADEFLKECIAGNYRLFDFEFDNASARIESIEDTLMKYASSMDFKRNTLKLFKVLCEAFGRDSNGVEDPDRPRKKYAKEMTLVMNQMYFGPPGTGKTVMCNAMSAALGVPVYQFTVTGGTEEGNFNKMPRFKDDGTVGMKNQVFREGFEHGGIIVIDEVNLGKPDVLMFLSGALERPYLLGQDADDQIKRHAATIIIATCNPGTEGTKLQNTAFYNRFRHWTEFEPTTPEMFKKMIVANRRDIDFTRKELDKMLDLTLDVYMTIRNGLEHDMAEMGQLTTVLSLRSLLGVVENVMDFGATLRQGIMESLIPPIQYFVQENGDPDTKEQFRATVIRAVTEKLAKAAYGKKYGTEVA